MRGVALKLTLLGRIWGSADANRWYWPPGAIPECSIVTALDSTLNSGALADHSSKELPIFWIFPYFFESRILEFFPSFTMMDYQVDYDNHALYKHGKTGRKQSPVRIFTNISPSMIVLPVEEGYRFCSVCQRYVSLGNQHCEICNSCTSKGAQYVRLSVDLGYGSAWIHCNTCNRCALQGHTCESAKAVCFICSGAGHKRSTCPNLSVTERAGNADAIRRYWPLGTIPECSNVTNFELRCTSQVHRKSQEDPTTTPPLSMDICKGGVSRNREEDFVDEEEEEENAQQVSGESILPGSQDLFITLEPIPPKAGSSTLKPEKAALVNVHLCKCFYAPPIISVPEVIKD
ncbi:Zinc finger CCHC domain-containing protein 4 [Chelonia mydas]|uniref:Zinc finger CCHC domain-containing protein 4 n=1 Tax=Chelonia mydas TaxID=8469 RepID=M7BHM2_CHEMY|nr:Zinc finger CCHC domain-containing protein 4 [Chelonia mydas]